MASNELAERSNKMKKIMILVTIALLVIGSSLNAQSRNGKGNGNNSNGMRMGMQQGQGIGFGDRNGSRFERMKTLLNLTDEQSVKISDMKFEHDKLALEANGEIQEHRLIVRKMMTDNKIDKEKLLKITSTNSELQGKIKLSRTTMWLEVYNILDDKQKEQWTKTFGEFGNNRNNKNFHKSRRGGLGNNNYGGKFNQRRM